MNEVFVWLFVALIALVFVCMIYDSLKCKHEWEKCEATVYDKKIGNMKALIFTCKKCGKVKVIK